MSVAALVRALLGIGAAGIALLITLGMLDARQARLEWKPPEPPDDEKEGA